MLVIEDIGLQFFLRAYALVSLLSLSPGSKTNPTSTHWDFSSIASLARNIFECSLTFFYLGTDKISEDEWFLRLKVMQLHDCLSRFRMFRDFDPNDSQLSGFEGQADEIRKSISSNRIFISLHEKQRNKLLKGEQAWILIQDEILERMGEKDSKTRGYYRFLSSHVHSFPLAFYRMAEHDIGRGVESEIEKGYAASVLESSSEILNRSTDDMEKIFSNLVINPNKPFDWDSLQGRRITL